MRTSMGSKEIFLGHEKLKMLVVTIDDEGDIKNQNPQTIASIQSLCTLTLSFLSVYPQSKDDQS